MLRARLITAAVLLALLLAALFLLSSRAWAGVALVILFAGGWEWGRLAGLRPAACRAYAVVTGAAGCILWFLLWQKGAEGALAARVSLGLLATSVLFWCLIAPLWLARGWKTRAPLPLAIVGWIVLLPTWLALAVLRAKSPWLVLGVMALPWLSDSAAYFVGRRFGRHKLAPSISPGKTWEGVAGAFVAVLLYGGVAAACGLGVWLVPAALMLGMFGIVGDLFESWMKRLAGLKDSSHLLPGHGGVLDRIDALTSTLPLASLLLLQPLTS
jgi:phosphatidate cytidylyltransferase